MYILVVSHIVLLLKRGGVFWVGGVDSGRVAQINLLKKGAYSRRGVDSGRVAHMHLFKIKGCIFWEEGVDSGSRRHFTQSQ